MPYTLSRRDFIRQARGLALATPFLSLVACEDRDVKRKLTAIRGDTMGTTYSVKIADLPKSLDRGTLAAEIDRLLETVNDQMSTYRPRSELSRFNDAAAGVWEAVSPDTLAVVDEALRISRLTEGAFDPTVGPLVDLWGFGPGGESQRVPSAERIAAARARIGYDAVRTRSAAPALGKDRSGLRVDLSGIAKGFGVDKIAEHLEAAGVEHYLVEIGGELRGRGQSPEDRPWRVGIEKPRAAPGTVQRVVRVDGRAVATSGDYRIFFESAGQRFSHIVNPQSGRPVDHGLASATVVADTTMQADALSTALLVLGPEAGLALAKRENIAAHFVAKTGSGFEEFASPAFAEHRIA